MVEIPISGLERELLAGDAAGTVIEKVIGKRPCGGCLKMRKLVNKVPVKFVPKLEQKEVPTPEQQGKKIQASDYYVEGVEEIMDYIVRKYPSALTPEQQKDIRDHIQKLKGLHK